MHCATYVYITYGAHRFRGFLCLYIFQRLPFFPDGSQLWFPTGFFLVLIIVVTLVGNSMVTRSKVEMIGNWLRLQICSGSLCARHRKDSSTTVQLFSLFSRLRWLGGGQWCCSSTQMLILCYRSCTFNFWIWQVGFFVMIPGLVHEVSGAWTLGEFLCEVSTFLRKISFLSWWWSTDLI